MITEYGEGFELLLTLIRRPVAELFSQIGYASRTFWGFIFLGFIEKWYSVLTLLRFLSVR
jgi:hypothetical protein